MDRQSEHLTKLQISTALGQRATRVAVLIVESIHLGIDLIDEQHRRSSRPWSNTWRSKPVKIRDRPGGHLGFVFLNTVSGRWWKHERVRADCIMASRAIAAAT
jgi:hypothetical protein